MTRRRTYHHPTSRFALAITGLCFLATVPAQAQNVVYFDPAAAGQDKSVPTWGVDTAWPSYDNVRQSIEHIGQGNVDVVRVLVYFDEPLVDLGHGNYELNAAAKAKVDAHLALAALAGTDPALTFGTGGTFPDEIDASYLSGGGINVTQYARAIKATQAYINSQAGFTGSSIYAIEPFNEPDYGITSYSNPADLNSVIAQLKTYAEFQSTYMMAPSTLNSDNAQWWYDQVPEATAGSSHLLAGSMTSWTNFISHVQNDGNPFMNPELHSMGEILVGADRGMEMGMVWADVLRGRGTLIQASDGDRLGYAEDLATNSAAAVYRAPDGNMYAFAGGVERDYMGAPNSFRFVSTGQDVYFNGIPVNEFMLQTKNDETNDFENYGSWSSEGSFANIDLDGSGIPALDGYRWKIVNAQDGSVMEVVNGGTGDGAMIESASDDGGLNQKWQIIRTRNGYYQLYNAYSGKTAEVAGLSLSNGADVRQWGTADNMGQQWFIEEAGNGNFYIRNGNSNLYMNADTGSNNIDQYESTGGANQQWYFVLDNPTNGPEAQYLFQGTAGDNVGTNHGTAFGNPAYTDGPFGDPNTAIDLDGSNDYVQLPSTVANSDDITISTWVKWDGTGGAWQRIFDFGNDTNEYMFLTPSSGSNTMRFAITTGSDAEEQILETDPLPSGQWVYLTLTLGGNTGILYVDGVPQVAGQILLDPTDFNPVSNYIGKSQWSSDAMFNGAIADFQIFDYALDMTQVSTLYADSFPTYAGDLNGDGYVGLDDLQLILDNWNRNVRDGFIADVNGDNYIGLDDLQAVLDDWNKGVVPPSPSANIPEPASLTLLGLGGLAVLRRR